MKTQLLNSVANSLKAKATPQIQADWSQTDETALDYIKNKPDIQSEAQIQPDWNQADETALDYIKNKPQIISMFSNCIFVGNGGSDNNNGLTWDTRFETLEKANEEDSDNIIICLDKSYFTLINLNFFLLKHSIYAPLATIKSYGTRIMPIKSLRIECEKIEGYTIDGFILLTDYVPPYNQYNGDILLSINSIYGSVALNNTIRNLIFEKYCKISGQLLTAYGKCYCNVLTCGTVNNSRENLYGIVNNNLYLGAIKSI